MASVPPDQGIQTPTLSTPPPTTTTSPRRKGANTMTQVHPLGGSIQDYRNSTRTALKVDLKDKIVYEDPQSIQNILNKCLHINDIDDTDVNECAKSLKIEKSADIEKLNTLAQRASGRKVQDLETEEKEDTDATEDRRGGSSQEKEMYDPLVNIFDYISEYPFARGQAMGSRLRKFCQTKGMIKPDTPQEFAFPRVSPDLSVVNAQAEEGSKIWSNLEAFVEVKASIKQGPKSAKGETIPAIVTQCADYSRLFLAARPFMLSCIGILIFGTHFCVGIFDRDGITFSPSYNMFDDLGISMFVRVVRSISHLLTMNQLGFDPSVCMLTKEGQDMLITDPNDKELNPHFYPSFLVTVSTATKLNRVWCTIGPPIWTSASLVGRGTNVWYIKEYMPSTKKLAGPQMILKGAWRNSSRLKESDVYHHIKTKLSSLKGIAQWECGGDVLFPNSGFPITVDNLRHPNRDKQDPNLSLFQGKPTPTLHRLVLSTTGRLLYKYRNETELLTAIRDAMQGHKRLCDVGILHRDISIGNIFLSDKGGFLGDFDIAWVPGESISAPRAATRMSYKYKEDKNTGAMVDVGKEITIEEIAAKIAIERGMEMTGTLQFMARELLNSDSEAPEQKIPHAVHHDVESFIWVLCCAVLRWMWDRFEDKSNPLSDEIKKEKLDLARVIIDNFTQPTPEKIASHRNTHSSAITFPKKLKIKNTINQFMSTHLIQLFQKFTTTIHRSNDPESPVRLTHELVLKEIGSALSHITNGNTAA